MNRMTLLTISSALVAGSLVSVRAQTPATVRIGLATGDTYAEAFYGDEAGIFKANELTVDLKPLPNSAAIAAAMIGGSLDVGVGSPSQVAQARQNGLPFYFFAPSALYTADAPTTVLMAAKNSPIRRAADLVGKTIAVENLKSLGQLALFVWMQKNGVDPQAAKYIEIPAGATASALVIGRVDAAVISEPGVAAARPTCRQVANPLEAVARRFYISAWFSTKAWLEGNPGTARRFVTAIKQTAAWANRHQKETAPILARVTKLPPEVIATMIRARYGETMDVTLMEPLLQLAVTNGLLTTQIGAKELIYPGFE